MDFNALTKHIKELNQREQILHNQRAQAAIQRIKSLRESQRRQQEALARENTTGEVS